MTWERERERERERYLKQTYLKMYFKEKGLKLKCINNNNNN